jgi:hypothetical protein
MSLGAFNPISRRQAEVVPRQEETVRNRSPDDSLAFWVTGCSEFRIFVVGGIIY